MIRALIVVFAWLAFFTSASAETQPATLGTYSPSWSHWTDNHGKGYSNSTAEGLCQQLGAWYFGGQGSFIGIQDGAVFTQKSCVFSYSGSTWTDLKITGHPVCANGGTFDAAVNACTGYTCPDSSWTLQGQTCIRQSCPVGQTWNSISGKCRCDSGSDVGDDGQCCPQPGEQIATMQHCYVSDASSTSCMTSAANGCTIRCTDVTFQKPKGGDQVVIGPFLALGQMCKYTGSYSPEDYGGGSLSDDELRDINERTKTPGDPATPSSCLGQGMGYVTGSNGTTCVGSGKGGDVTKNTSTKTDDGKGTTSDTTTKSTTGADGSSTTTKTTTTHNADGTTTTTTTTTSHNPDGSITETVKTETTDANGTKTGETTSKDETTDKGAWCSSHPDDPACKVDECPEGSDKASCSKLGDPESLPNPDLPTEERGISSISPVGIAASASCPRGAPLPFDLGYMPLDGICDLASGIRPVLLALAWLSAGLIVLGGFREP